MLAAAVDGDGRLVFVGLAESRRTMARRGLVERTSPDGTLDPSFYGLGWRHIYEAQSPIQSADMALWSVLIDGTRIVAAGSDASPFSLPSLGVVVALDASGDLDRTFNRRGLYFDNARFFYGVARRTDGYIVSGTERATPRVSLRARHHGATGSGMRDGRGARVALQGLGDRRQRVRAAHLPTLSAPDVVTSEAARHEGRAPLRRRVRRERAAHPDGAPFPRGSRATHDARRRSGPGPDCFVPAVVQRSHRRRLAMRFTAPFFATFLVGCGARTALDVPDDGSAPDIAAVDAARVDTAIVDASSPDATRPDVTPPVDVPSTACARWTATSPRAITNPDRDRAPGAVRVLDDRVWIGYQSSNPDPPGNQAWFVQVTDALGAPVAEARRVLPSPGELQGYGPLSLWTDPVTRVHAAMAWDEGRGCNIVRLADDATPRGAPLRVADVDCSSVVATRDGWSLLTRESAGGVFTQLHVIDDAGRERSTLRLPGGAARVVTATRLVFSDGTFLFAWATPTAVFARRFDASGRSVGAEESFDAGVSVSAIRLAESNGEVVLGWSGSIADADARIALTRVSRDGVRASPTASMTMPGPRVGDWSVAVNGADLALLWNSGGAGRDATLRFAVLDAQRLTERSAIDVPGVGFPHQMSLRATSRSFVGVYGALPRAGLTEVWTIAFRCDAR